MPDLQSELNKVLTQAQFDDEPAQASTYTAPEPDNKKSKLQRAWECLREHPMSDAVEVSNLTGVDAEEASTMLSSMYKRGELSRSYNERTKRYMYSALHTTRDFTGSNLAALELARKARSAKAAERREILHKAAQYQKPKKRKVRSDKGTTRAAVVPPAVTAPPPSPTAFNVDEIISNLNVLQAKQLLTKLKEVFGV